MSDFKHETIPMLFKAGSGGTGLDQSSLDQSSLDHKIGLPVFYVFCDLDSVKLQLCYRNNDFEEELSFFYLTFKNIILLQLTKNIYMRRKAQRNH